MNDLIYNGTEIQAKGESLNLTDMWRAEGADPSRKPAEWLRSAEALRFIDFLVEVAGNKVGNSHLFKIAKGRSGSTMAHWQIGLAYAKYLSPEFHMWCNTVVRERMEGRAVSVDVLTPGEVGGVFKKVLWKQVPEIIFQIVERYLPPMIEARLAADPRVAAVAMVSQRQLIERAKVPSKGRSPLNRKFCHHMPLYALKKGVKLMRCPHSGVWLYPVDLAEQFMDDHGNLWIAEHKAKLAGQGVLRLIPIKQVKPTPEARP